MQWRYWQGNRLVIHRSWGRVLVGHHCVVALGKLLTPVCPCHQALAEYVCSQGHGSRSNIVVSYVKDRHYATVLCDVV